MNPTVELVLKHKKANMRKSEFLMLEALKSAPHLNDIPTYVPIFRECNWLARQPLLLHIKIPNDDFDWAQMADEALANADTDDTEALPPPPDVIIIDDDDDVPLPPCIKQTLDYLPKIEPGTSSTNLPTPRSPTSPP